jgi:hypothetical protein
MPNRFAASLTVAGLQVAVAFEAVPTSAHPVWLDPARRDGASAVRMEDCCARMIDIDPIIASAAIAVHMSR